jgi:hypothetical protein
VHHRYREAKAAAPEHYQHRLLLLAFSAWRDRTAAKQLSEQQRRLAVRHCYLSTLTKVLQAWRLAMVAAGHKQQLDEVACGHHRRKLLISFLQVRRHPQHQGVTQPWFCLLHGSDAEEF